MYYNYTEEQKYFLSVTNAMLKDDYSVEEIVEFWNCEDQDQVDGILGSLTLTESVDYDNPDLAVVCERFGLGWITKGAQRLWRGLRGINPKTGNPRITGSKPPGPVSKVKDKLGQTGAVIKKATDKLPPGVKGAAAISAGSLAILGAQDALDNMRDSQQTTTNSSDPEEEEPAKPTYNEPPKTKPVAGGKKWWQTYEKTAPYSSSRQYYRNIRAK